mmetsp:Transcript_3443/g.7888  ORF Transcript_3443/g.7888 Transcript_3443/m.7888 type:complete len:591 (+) Transcript_3443:120-1892(+)
MKFASPTILLSILCGITSCGVGAFSCTSKTFLNRFGKHQLGTAGGGGPATITEIKGLGAATNGQSEASNNDNGDGASSVDRAPCFDGVCVSEPELSPSSSTDEPPMGEATTRLGTMTGPTVWSEFGRLSQEHEVANLGQGFPDWLPPKFAVDSLVEAAMDSAQSPHQYTRTAGHPNLVKQLARRYSVHMKREIEPMAEVAVTVGASQALYLSLQTLIKPGDEVILFEPFFDLYVNQVKLAGGTPVYVPLTFVPYDDTNDDAVSGGEWILEREKLQTAVSPKTRAVILNSPHNPTGKVFTRKEMGYIADAVKSAGPNCIVLSDEVYKYIVHAPPKEEVEQIAASNGESGADSSSRAVGHIHFASLNGMWDRTITISSAGKTFSATGWQVGWCIGPEHLISPIHQLLPYVQFCASTVIQEALARALPRADEPYEGYSSYYEYLKAKYTKKRDLLGRALRAAGFAIQDYDRSPGGGFFIFARIGKGIANAIPKARLMAANSAAPGGVARQDWALCQWMAEEKGLLCIPASPFFSRERALEGASDEFVRVAFCKQDETIEEAALALLQINGEVASGSTSPEEINVEEEVDLQVR